MEKTKNTLTIKDWAGTGTEKLELELNAGYSIVSRGSGETQSNTLTVTRKPDKHSPRFAMMAYLRHNKDGYGSLGFPEMILTVDKQTAAGKFLSRKIFSFAAASLDSYAKNGDEETLVFVCGELSEITVSKNGIFFN